MRLTRTSPPARAALGLAAALLGGGLVGPAAQAVSGDAYRVCGLDPNGDNFLALRSGPSSSHDMIMQLGPGSVVEARGERHGKWLEVVVESANGTTYLRDLPTGFVFTTYICPI